MSGRIGKAGLKETRDAAQYGNLDIAREIGAKLPDVAASAGKLGVALKIKGKILACKAINRSAEPGSLMVRVGTPRRDALLAEDPEAFLSDRTL